MSKVLVTGGCGYIGSHTIIDLINNGYNVVSLDNGSNSSLTTVDLIEEITGVKVINHNVDLCNRDGVARVFAQEGDIDTIIHFAALKAVGDSVAEPLVYFRNNVTGLINLLEVADQHEVKSFIFSSSCTVYGNAEKIPVTEDTPWQEAVSPYGRTKQIGEQIIKDFLPVSKMNAVMLRYFNPAGAHESIKIGEAPSNKAQNLVPVITETAIGKRDEMYVFGTDYATRDGSCVRDYIHVMDLADAHTRAMKFLHKQDENSQLEVFNLGIGEGVTVLEAINAFEKVSNTKLNYKVGPRRDGDVEAIYANNKKANEILGWNPQRGIEDIMSTAWEWEKNRG